MITHQIASVLWDKAFWMELKFLGLFVPLRVQLKIKNLVLLKALLLENEY